LVLDRLCEEICVVREGETLHKISAKNSDPHIVERNPHIHDPDDSFFPGLVIKIIHDPDDFFFPGLVIKIIHRREKSWEKKKEISYA
ncbi:hypothetical protein CFP56_011779, partial [Quercus suber]